MARKVKKKQYKPAKQEIKIAESDVFGNINDDEDEVLEYQEPEEEPEEEENEETKVFVDENAEEEEEDERVVVVAPTPDGRTETPLQKMRREAANKITHK